MDNDLIGDPCDNNKDRYDLQVLLSVTIGLCFCRLQKYKITSNFLGNIKHHLAFKLTLQSPGKVQLKQKFE